MVIVPLAFWQVSAEPGILLDKGRRAGSPCNEGN